MRRTNPFVMGLGVAFVLSLVFGVWPAEAASPATLEVVPSYQTVGSGETVTVEIRVRTEEAVNAFQVNLSFPPQLLEAVALDTEGSWATLWVTGSPSYSNETGTVSFRGGRPTPGFRGEGLIGRVTFRTKGRGEATLALAGETKVLANDGQGTDLLGRKQGARILVLGDGERPPVGRGWYDLAVLATLGVGGLLLFALRHKRR